MRYISHAPSEIHEMLETLGIPGVESLFDDVSDNVKLARDMNRPQPQSEVELKSELLDISKKNKAADYVNFIGAGAYDHLCPVVSATQPFGVLYLLYTVSGRAQLWDQPFSDTDYDSKANWYGCGNVSIKICKVSRAILMACNIKKKIKCCFPPCIPNI